MIGSVYHSIIEHSYRLLNQKEALPNTSISDIRFMLIQCFTRQASTYTRATQRHMSKMRRLNIKIFKRFTHPDKTSFAGQLAHQHIRNRLRPNQSFPRISGLGKTLWGYYNSPLNALFVTTNVLAFAGTVAFATFMDIRNHGHNYGMPVYMTGANHRGSGDGQGMGELEDERVYREILRQQDKIMKSLREQIDSKVEALKLLEKEKDKGKNHETKNILGTDLVADEEFRKSPVKTYSMDSIEISDKLGKIANYRSVILKASLFNMLYTYKLYEDVVNEVSTGQSCVTSQGEWLKEVEYLKSKVPPIQNETFGKSPEEVDLIANFDMKPDVDMFYQMWERHFAKTGMNMSINSLENFKLPNWNGYPPVLRNLCSKLYDNKMGTFNDFRSYYKQVDSKKYKKLLALWFFDNCRLFKSLDRDVLDRDLNENFYNEITQDFKNDTHIFDKYASIVLEPGNSKGMKFFRSRTVRIPRSDAMTSVHWANSNGSDAEQTVTIPFVSLDTMLNIMEGYIDLRKRGDSIQSQQQQQKQEQAQIWYSERKAIYNDKLIRIVQMLKGDVILLQNREQKNTNDGDLKVQLCDDHELNLIDEAQRSSDVGKWQDDRTKCYEKLSKEPRLIELLKQLE